jgi:glycosyltransferase involved in cell wall biosynthesis
MAVTIAIPFFNADKYLEDAIRSVFAQTYQDWELLLIDDGSTDGSLTIAKSIKDTRVRVISDGLNKKLAARLNEVTKLAKYDYIARMDADDLMSPDRIKTQMDLFKKNKDIDLISTGVYSILNNEDLIGYRGSNFSNYTFEDILYRRKGFVHAALIAKKEWYKRNTYNESLPFAQDRDLWLKSSKNNDFKALSIKEPLYFYREEDNVTKGKLLSAYRLERKMYFKYCESYPLKLIMVSYIKSLLVKGLDFFGILYILQKKRATAKVNTKMRIHYKSALRIVKNTNLPI